MMNRARVVEAILPEAGKGGRGETFFSKNCFSSQNADTLYQYLKLSLLDINNWNKHNSAMPIVCKLLDRHGQYVGRIAQPRDRIKVVLPRWQSIFRLYDWFEIQKIEERLSGDTEFFFLTIVNSDDPAVELFDISGFSRHQASMTIFIIRDDNKVDLQIHTSATVCNNNKKTFKEKLASGIKSLFMQNGFYQRQWAKLLKTLLKEGSSKFLNLN